ncbi:molybdenum ABC transporter ATP-binding protein, partial [Erwinia amylovora]|nr:molybdenum ABC transporter ATP-binding protein [Erwinia amylovora]
KLGDHRLTIQAARPARGGTAIGGVSGAGQPAGLAARAGLTVPLFLIITLTGSLLSDTYSWIWLAVDNRIFVYFFQVLLLFPLLRV